MGRMMSVDSTVHEILVQMLIAFGQGAGTMRVSREVIEAATAYYVERIERSANRWNTIELHTLDLARSLGRLAAHLALHDGQDVILPRHYQTAFESLARVAECAFCLERVPPR